MRRITTCLWFKDRALEAAKFWASVIPNSRVGAVSRYTQSSAKVSGRPAGSILTVSMTLAGQRVMLLNGGPAFKLSPVVSLIVECRDQKEIDRIWQKLISGGGRESMCGWLVDRFGFSWQVVPANIDRLMMSGSEAARDRVMQAILKMRKLDLAKLESARKG